MQTGSAKTERRRSERKDDTRRRIMAAAGVLFRRHGIDGVGVDAIMREAGLTHGGFYVHFPSKEALAAAVCAASLTRGARLWADSAADAGGGEAALRRIVDAYLSPERVAGRETGCVLPTLGADLARRPEAHAALAPAIDEMAGTLAACRPGADRERGMADLSCMVGAVLLARLAGDPALAEQILRAARSRVLGAAPGAAG
ncbi:MAG: TetR/AcrR family transcriptional regulator [Acetobacteraceae bacterium]|nr:TetR/AcrR family transcriptional regulator [Acetobacteraceae bacterium]